MGYLYPQWSPAVSKANGLLSYSDGGAVLQRSGLFAHVQKCSIFKILTQKYPFLQGVVYQRFISRSAAVHRRFKKSDEF